MEDAPSDFVSVYIYYRYDLMSRLFPHSAFGTNRTTEFFEDTLRFLNDPESLNVTLKVAIKEQQTYEIAYLKWVKSHSDNELSNPYA